MTAKEHNRLAGIFLLAHGSLQIFSILVLFIVWVIMFSGFYTQFQSVGREISTKQGDEYIQIFGLAVIFSICFTIFITFTIVTPQIVGGWKLLKEKPNARTWGIVGSIFSCLSFPLGTAAGVYGLWFLFGDIGKNYYLANNSNQNMFDTPPPPQNWA